MAVKHNEVAPGCWGTAGRFKSISMATRWTPSQCHPQELLKDWVFFGLGGRFCPKATGVTKAIWCIVVHCAFDLVLYLLGANYLLIFFAASNAEFQNASASERFGLAWNSQDSTRCPPSSARPMSPATATCLLDSTRRWAFELNKRGGEGCNETIRAGTCLIRVVTDGGGPSTEAFHGGDEPGGRQAGTPGALP